MKPPAKPRKPRKRKRAPGAVKPEPSGPVLSLVWKEPTKPLPKPGEVADAALRCGVLGLAALHLGAMIAPEGEVKEVLQAATLDAFTRKAAEAGKKYQNPDKPDEWKPIVGAPPEKER